MNKAQRKVAIDLNIKAAHIVSPQPYEIVILWKRGILYITNHTMQEPNRLTQGQGCLMKTNM